jgi:hypothetical protein
VLHVVPIESYERRYSAQWNRWFPAYLESVGIAFDYLTVDLPQDVRVDDSEVLDPFATHVFKFRQLELIVQRLASGRIGAGDTLLFHTLWFPGIEALQYIRQSQGIDVKIVGVLHAGSYDPRDFRSRLGMDPWASHVETGWLTLVDRVFVASQYHRDLLLSARAMDPKKVHVTGLPLDIAEVRGVRSATPKEDLVAFPHRDVPEKDPGVADRISPLIFPAVIARTRLLSADKDGYYDILARCKVCLSNSLQETFGYSMLEAAALRCVPVVPDRLSYREFYPPEFRFGSEEEMVRLVRRALSQWKDPTEAMRPALDFADGALARIVELALDW